MVSKVRSKVRNKVKRTKMRNSHARLGTQDDGDSGDSGAVFVDDGAIDMREEVRLFVNLAAPNVIIQLLQFTLWFTNAVVAGQWLGTDELAAVSLGNLAGNLTGLSLVFGVLSALDTLVPQAMGAGNFAEIGILTQRATVLCFIICIPCFVIWWRMEEILLFFDQPPVASAYAGRFLKIYCLALPPLIVVEVCKRFLGCQNIVVAAYNMRIVFCFHFTVYITPPGTLLLDQFVHSIVAPSLLILLGEEDGHGH